MPNLRGASVNGADQVNQFHQAQGPFRPATDVERLAADRIHLLHRAPESFDQIVDKKRVADLSAISVEGDRLLLERPQNKMREPALVFVSELMNPINAAHPEDGRADSKRIGVVQDVLIRGSFRAAIRT